MTNAIVVVEGECDNETYEIRKGYMEHFLCKVQQPEPMYVFTNGKHKKPELLSPTQCALLLKPILSGKKIVLGFLFPSIKFGQMTWTTACIEHLTLFHSISMNQSATTKCSTCLRGLILTFMVKQWTTKP